MNLRHVLVGERDGDSVVLADEMVAPSTWSAQPGSEFHNLWGVDETPTLPISDVQPFPTSFVPPPGGVRFAVHRIPGSSVLSDVSKTPGALPDLENILPGLARYMDPDDPGMHRTPTVDTMFVLEGEVVLELDSGVSVTLGPGQVLTQSGVRHRWSSPGPADAVVVLVMVGARSSLDRSEY